MHSHSSQRCTKKSEVWLRRETQRQYNLGKANHSKVISKRGKLQVIGVIFWNMCGVGTVISMRSS